MRGAGWGYPTPTASASASSLLLWRSVRPSRNGIGDAGGDETDGADGVVVGGDGVGDAGGVGVGVADRHDGDAQADRLLHREIFLGHVDDEHDPRQAGHVAQTAQVAAQALNLFVPLERLALGQELELAGGLLLFQAQHVVNAGLNGLPVGQGAAQPAVDDVRHLRALGFGPDDLLGLLFGADE